MLQPDRLAKLLREYASAGADEYDRCRLLHFEISNEVFSHAADLASIIEAQRKRQREAIEDMHTEARRLGLDD